MNTLYSAPIHIHPSYPSSGYAITKFRDPSIDLNWWLGYFKWSSSKSIDRAFIVLHKIRVGLLDQFPPVHFKYKVGLNMYHRILTLIETQFPKMHEKALQRSIRIGAMYYKQRRVRNKETKEYFTQYIKRSARQRWMIVRMAVVFLGLQARAVVTANHPSRLTFDID